MSNCSVCLKPVNGEMKNPGYHDACLRRLVGTAVLPALDNLSYGQLVRDGKKRLQSGQRFSVSGVQVKLVGKVKKGKPGQPSELLVAESGGDLILKPDAKPEEYPGLPANEHLSMLIAKAMGLDVPACGLLPLDGNSYLYVIRRFDRKGNGQAVHQEDLMQALGIANKHDAKYEAVSYESAGRAVMDACGRGQVAAEYMKRLIAMFAIGNGDYHLKNMSLLMPVDEPVSQTPIYDVVNTQVYDDPNRTALSLMDDDDELIAFNLNGFETRQDFMQLGKKLGVAEKAIATFIDKKIVGQREKFTQLVEASFLPAELKQIYQTILDQHIKLLSQ